MRAPLVTTGFALLGLLGLLAPGAAATDVSPVAHCNPPCGLIPVVVTITLEKSTGLAFGAEDKVVLKGTVEYYWDIDQDGYAYDPNLEMEMKIDFYRERVPGWIEPKVEPAKVKVPVRPQDNCSDCVQPDTAQGQGNLMFRWTHPITVTLEKKRAYDPAELRQYLRGDGMYRVTLQAETPASLTGNSQTGQPAGLLEGYVLKDMKFMPELGPGTDGTRDPGGAAGAPSFVAPLLAAALGFALVRGRR